MRKDTVFWNIFFILLYILELTFLIYFLDNKGIEIQSSIGLLDIIILAFATFRISRLVTKGKITDFIRNYFGRHGKGFRGTIYELMICSWCASVWVVLFLMNLYFFVPGGWIIILIFAISGVSCLIQSYTSK